MRSDMFKVIVERPRKGGYVKPNKRVLIREDGENLPKYESMTMRYNVNYGRKNLNENLSPLWRFIEGRVGRPWDNVWSEICEHLDNSSTVKKHVKDHAKDHVIKDLRIIDDVPHIYRPTRDPIYKGGKLIGYETIRTHNDGWVPLDRYHYYKRNILYVDPRDGILKVYTRRTSDKSGWRDPPMVTADQIILCRDGSRYEKWEGVWYHTHTYKKKVWVTTYLIHLPKNPDGTWKTKKVEEEQTTTVTRQVGGKELRCLHRWLDTGEWYPPARKGRRRFFRKV